MSRKSLTARLEFIWCVVQLGN
uniref:Uncharacterized protein n=1 Tax=Arundo donax TaxID=35708 RepID=A0A0A8Y2V0_ARUDO